MERFIGDAQSLLDQLADSDVAGLERLRAALGETEAGPRAKSSFSFNEVIHVAEPASPLRFAADVAPGVIAHGAIERDAEAFLGWLVAMNVKADLSRLSPAS